MTRITIKEIADELSISASTVSRALRNDTRISSEVTQVVKSTAARLGYIPNIGASNLRMGKTKIIGLVVRDLRDGFCVEVIPSVEAACAESNYGLLLCDCGADPQKEREYLQTLRQRRVDGISIITPILPIPDPYLLVRRDVPISLIDIDFDGSLLCAVTVDHNMGGYLSTRHLLDLGHRHIAFLSGPLTLTSCVRYIEGYRRAMAECGIQMENQIVVIGEKTESQDGYNGMLDILKISPQPTAVATASDLMAAGALKAARDCGLSVPEDISIVGYDDIPLSSLLSPSLTTIKQNKDDLGSIAIKLLLEEIQGENHQHQQIRLPPSLLVRASTSPPPSRSARKNYL